MLLLLLRLMQLQMEHLLLRQLLLLLRQLLRLRLRH
jgi:hypothetical protein